MRPFFSYYGSKYLGARRYGPPRRDLVVEPFAGSACYATYWAPERVRLYDLSEDVCAAWDWLINCSESDVRAIPDKFETNEEWLALPDGPRQVVLWNISYALSDARRGLVAWYLHYAKTGERIGRLANTGSRYFWGPIVKERIINQQPAIRGWSIERRDYREIPLDDAHYFVDPPYQGSPGRAYEHSEIDFPALGEWCRSLPGAVDVCENEGADWLPFVPLYSVKSMQSEKQSREVVWRNDIVDLLDVIRHSESGAAA